MPAPQPRFGGADTFSRISPAQATGDAIPILVDDTYHVFRLTTPPYTKHHPERLRSSWWRLRSTDLVNWTCDAQPSITPGSSAEHHPDATDATGSPDADGAWTGAAVLGLDGAMHIFYTGYNLGQGGRQVILQTRAASRDQHPSGFGPGREIQISGSGRDALEDIDFRDPYVFYHAAESRYWMIVASRLARGPHSSRGCLALLTSPDLDAWTFAPQPLYQPNDLFCPECPELFYLPSSRKWYLFYSRFHAPDAGTVYRIADSPYGPFRIPRDGSHGRLDGRRWYAAKSCAKAGDPDARIFFGWIGDHLSDEGKWLWAGDLGVPRQVSLVSADEGYLQVQPAPAAVAMAEQTSLAVPETAVPANLTLASSTLGTTTVLPLSLAGSAAETDMSVLVTVQFHVTSCDAHAFGIVLQPDADECGYRLCFAPSVSGADAYTVTLFTDFPPLDDFWSDQYNMHLPRPVDGPEMVRHDNVVLGQGTVSLFLRRQLVELFCGGRSISFRLPVPSQDGPQQGPADGRRLSWFVQDGQVLLRDIAVRTGGYLDKTVWEET